MISGTEASLLPQLFHQGFISQTDSAVLASTSPNNYSPAEPAEPRQEKVFLDIVTYRNHIIRGTYRNQSSNECFVRKIWTEVGLM
jgi:hypothetical protein